MPRLADPKCPNCHASLPVDPTATMLKCQYCGNEVLVKKTQYHPAQQPGTPPAAGPPMNLRDAVKLAHQLGNVKPIRVSRLVIIIPVVIVFAIVASGIYVSFTVQRKVTHQARSIQKHATDPERASWVTYNRQVVARVNDDDVDDLILLGHFYNDDSKVYLVAIDGASQKRLWKAGDFGDISTDNANTRTKYALVGDELVLIDGRSTAKVLALATGRELRSVGLTDRGEWICRYPGDDTKVWIDVSDKNHVDFAIATAQTSPAPNRPGGCPGWSERTRCPDSGTSECVPESIDNKQLLTDPEGIDIRYGLRDAKTLFAFGAKAPGTPHRMVVGMDTTGAKARWARRVVEDVNQSAKQGADELSDVASGVAYVIYELRDVHHLIAVEGDQGKTLWDVVLPKAGTAIPPDPDGIVASPTRIFVIDHSTINVFDPADGALLGSAAANP